MLSHPPCNPNERAALMAVARGSATPNQQQVAVGWILNVACDIGVNPFVPGTPDQTAFNAGRQFVGQELAVAAGVPLYDLLRLKEEDDA